MIGAPSFIFIKFVLENPFFKVESSLMGANWNNNWNNNIDKNNIIPYHGVERRKRSLKCFLPFC